MQPRRIILLIGLILVAVSVGFGMYFLFFRQPPEDVPGIISAPPEPGAALPGAGVSTPPITVLPPAQGLPPGVSQVATGGVTVVTPVAAVPTSGASLTGNAISFYNRGEGKFYQMGADGLSHSLSEKIFRNVSNVVFAPQGNTAILEFPDGANVIYDFASNQQISLPQHWEDFEFNASGSEFVAKSIGSDPSSNFLVVANSDGTNARAVQELGLNADKVFTAVSPNNQVIAIAHTGEFSGPDQREVFFIGKNQENFKSMVVDGIGFVPQWAPSGERLLYSAASAESDYKPLLWIVDASGNSIGSNRRALSVNTWADKCTFGAGDTILYCAVPTSLNRGDGLQRQLTSSTPDTIVRIDTTTGLQSRVAIPEGQPPISKIMLSPDGRELFFVNAQTGSLNKIRLTP